MRLPTRLLVLPALLVLALLPATRAKVASTQATSAGQPAKAGPATDPCQRPELRQFAFWVGDWELTSTRRVGLDKDEWVEDKGRAADHVRYTLDGCAVQQEWDGTPADIPLKGISLSTFDAGAGKWRQIWLDNDGSYLDFAGEFRDGRMELYREGLLDGRKTIWRQVYSGIMKDRFDWIYQRSFDGGRTWITTWKLAYARKT